MHVLYKVEVWIKADIDSETSIEEILENVDDIPSGRVNFIDDENYITSTEKFIPSTEEATLEVYSNDEKLIYTNKEK